MLIRIKSYVNKKFVFFRIYYVFYIYKYELIQYYILNNSIYFSIIKEYTMARGRGSSTPQDLEYIKIISSNINRLLEYHNLKQIDLSKETGIPTSTITGYVKGTSLPIPGNIQKIADYFRVNKSDIDPRFKQLTDTKKQNKEQKKEFANDYQYIPYAVSAGELTEIDSINFYKKLSVPDILMGKYAGNKNIVLMPVNGESMNNVIANGSIIAVLTKTSLANTHDNDIVVIRHNGDYSVKRFYNDTAHQEYVFKPDSTDLSFRDIIFSYDNADDLELIGKVVMYSIIL